MVGMLSNKSMLDDTLELLMMQMIRDNFEHKENQEEKYIITKQELYRFCIRLIKIVREVYYDNR